LLALAQQAHAGGVVTWNQAARAIEPITDGLGLAPWSDPSWVAIPAATAHAVEAAVATAVARRVTSSSRPGARRGPTVDTIRVHHPDERA
jgi:hypothetical protein